jgi:hypothetical protein
MKLTQKALAVVAASFGIMTIAAGVRVLTGVDPGYIVFRPLLVFNTAMGIAYIAAGILAWRALGIGTYSAGILFAVNTFVLGAVGFLYANGDQVAIDSVWAMTFRTAFWFALFAGLAWIKRRSSSPET